MYSIVPREVPTGKSEVDYAQSAERSEFIIASPSMRGLRMVPSAKIEVTKHALLADEFIRYRLSWA